MIENIAIVGIYALHDVVAEQFGPSFEAINTATAVRAVRGMRISAYEDFKLVRIGYFNRQDGILEGHDHIEIPWVDSTYKKEMENKTLPFPLTK